MAANNSATTWQPKFLRQNPEAIRIMLDAKRWDIQDLAAHIGVSPAHMGRILNGHRNATPDLMYALAEAFNCPVTMLESRRPYDEAA